MPVELPWAVTHPLTGQPRPAPEQHVNTSGFARRRYWRSPSSSLRSC